MVRASLNLSARVKKSSIHYYECYTLPDTRTVSNEDVLTYKTYVTYITYKKIFIGLMF